MKSILKSVAVLCCMATLAVLAACTKGSNSTGEKPVYKYLHYYIQDNHAKGYQTKWGQWKRQFSDK